MARLLPNMPLLALAISLLLLAALLDPAAASYPPVKKPGMRFRYASKEEARWLDRYAETHEPLGDGPLRMRPATEVESQWLNRLNSDDTTEREGTDGEDGGRGYIEFDDGNPYVSCLFHDNNACIRVVIKLLSPLLLVCSYVHAVQAWASRLIKQGLEKAQAEVNNHCNYFLKLFCFVLHS
jgi:hypothetical protein